MGRTRLHEAQAEVRALKAELDAVKRAKDGCRTALSKSLPIGDHITILSVGLDFESIYVHTGLIPAPTKTWIASHGLVNGLIYPLIEESPRMLRLYRMYLLYTGKLASKDEDVVTETSGDSEWHELVLMYLFAKRIRDEKFGNSVVNALVEKVQEEDMFPTEFAHEVFGETTTDDPMRKLYVDLHVWVGLGSGIQAPYEDRNGPVEFLDSVRTGLEVAGEAVQDPEEKAPWELSLCRKYHKHELTDVCAMEDVEVIDLTGD